MNFLNLIPLYLTSLKALYSTRKARRTNVPEGNIIKLEHVIVLHTQAQELHLIRAPWSVSVETLSADIERFESYTGNVVTGIGCEFNSREETRALVLKLKGKLL